VKQSKSAVVHSESPSKPVCVPRDPAEISIKFTLLRENPIGKLLFDALRRILSDGKFTLAEKEPQYSLELYTWTGAMPVGTVVMAELSLTDHDSGKEWLQQFANCSWRGRGCDQTETAGAQALLTHSLLAQVDPLVRSWVSCDATPLAEKFPRLDSTVSSLVEEELEDTYGKIGGAAARKTLLAGLNKNADLGLFGRWADSKLTSRCSMRWRR
jgi:hypothetical protein